MNNSIIYRCNTYMEMIFDEFLIKEFFAECKEMTKRQNILIRQSYEMKVQSMEMTINIEGKKKANKM